MSDLSDFIGGKSNPTNVKPPKVVIGNKIVDGGTGTSGLDSEIPYPDDSGWYVKYGGSNISDITAYDNTNTLQWSVAHTHINASANGWVGFIHWDTVADKLYVCACVDNTRVYVASLNKTTGAITQEFDFAVTNVTSSTVEYANGFNRFGNDSGNWYISGNNSTIVVNDTGTIVEAEEMISNRGSVYRTSNGTYIARIRGGNSTDYTGGTYIEMYSKNNRKSIYITHIDSFYGVAGGNDTMSIVCVGNKVYLYTVSINNIPVYSRVFDRVDFDRWLEEIFVNAGGVI